MLMFCYFVLNVEQLLGASVYVVVGPCHHGMGRHQVAVGGSASNMEGKVKGKI
jgi:hypothetical protein